MLAYGRSKRTLRFSHQGTKAQEETASIYGGQYGVTPSGLSLSTPLEVSSGSPPPLRPSTPPKVASSITPRNGSSRRNAFSVYPSVGVIPFIHNSELDAEGFDGAAAFMKTSKHGRGVTGAGDRSAFEAMNFDRRADKPQFRMNMDFGEDSDDSDEGGGDRTKFTGNHRDEYLFEDKHSSGGNSLSREIQRELAGVGAPGSEASTGQHMSHNKRTAVGGQNNTSGAADCGGETTFRDSPYQRDTAPECSQSSTKSVHNTELLRESSSKSLLENDEDVGWMSRHWEDDPDLSQRRTRGKESERCRPRGAAISGGVGDGRRVTDNAEFGWSKGPFVSPDHLEKHGEAAKGGISPSPSKS